MGKASPDAQALFKPRLAAYLLMSHQPEQAGRPSPDSRREEQASTSWWEKSKLMVRELSHRERRVCACFVQSIPPSTLMSSSQGMNPGVECITYV